MSGGRSSSGFRAAGFGVLLAFCSMLRGLSYRFTARDGLLDTQENCDAACREAWKSYSARGNVWFELAAVLLVVSVAFGFWSRRTRGDIG